MSEKILVPTLGESVTEATVSKWLKNQGEKVSADEPIVELETDKVNVEVPAPSNGVLESISVREGETVNVGSLLGMINGSGNKISEDIKELKPYAKNATFHWCQEEPKNMGAWFSVRDYIQWTLDNIKAKNNQISYIGRSPDATPATAFAKRHIFQQKEIINKVFKK